MSVSFIRSPLKFSLSTSCSFYGGKKCVLISVSFSKLQSDFFFYSKLPTAVLSVFLVITTLTFKSPTPIKKIGILLISFFFFFSSSSSLEVGGGDKTYRVFQFSICFPAWEWFLTLSAWCRGTLSSVSYWTVDQGANPTFFPMVKVFPATLCSPLRHATLPTRCDKQVKWLHSYVTAWGWLGSTWCIYC